MGLRILGALVAVILVSFAVARYRRALLTRAEILMICPLVVALIVAAISPQVFDAVLSPLGLQPGSQRRLIGVLVLAVVFLLLLILWGFTKMGRLSQELADHVDSAALRRFEQEHAGAFAGACAVIIPAFNEAENLPHVLGAMPATVRGMPVKTVVVADGCSDGTELAAREMKALVIERDVRRGQGASVRLGYVAALRNSARYIVTMDADGQHDPREMHALLDPLMDGTAEMVQGSRVLGTSKVESVSRARGVRIFAQVLTRLGDVRITDPSNGYRAVLPEVLKRLDLRQDQFFVSEIIMDVLQKGVRLVEVPVTVHQRRHGTTKKGDTFRYGWGFTRTMGLTWLRHRVGRRSRTLQPRWLAQQVDDL